MKITMAHGSGGKSSAQLMKDIFGKYFSNDISVRRSASGKGTMTVKFASDEEVRKFLEALEKADI